jgi:SAM-dependent methyltransferase
VDLRTRVCFALSRRLIRPPPARQTDTDVYAQWRGAELARSLEAFDRRHLEERDVLDFGCGVGALAPFVATQRRPRSVAGVDLHAASWPRRVAGRMLMRMLRAGEYFVSSVVIELLRAAHAE